MIRTLEVEHQLKCLYVAAEGAGLREEDGRKAIEVAAMLREIEHCLHRFSNRAPVTPIDAAAGKSYVGLLAAKLPFEPAGRSASVVTIERDSDRTETRRRATIPKW